MTGRDRCDEILRLIDEVLGDQSSGSDSSVDDGAVTAPAERR